MTDRPISEDRIERALRVRADEALRPFDPIEIARLAAGTGSRLSRRWDVLSGRQSRPLRWVIVATALLLLAAISGLIAAALLRNPAPMGGSQLFVTQMVCNAGCQWPTGLRASTVDLGTGTATASWELPFVSTSMSGPSLQPAWSRDRRHVLLYDWNNQLIAIVDAEAGTLAALAGDDPTGITGYVWGPGSDRIARVSGGDSDGVTIVDLSLHELARFPLADSAMIGSSPAWSPDGSALAVIGCDPCDDSWQGSPHTPHQDQLFVLPVDGSPIRELPITPGSPTGPPAWSPDGKSVAFATGAGIWTMTVADGGQRAVTSGRDMNPRWSPDGGRLVFGSMGAREGGGIVVIDLDSGRQTPLTNEPDSRPQWSPDGTWIVFSRNSSPPGDGPSPGDIWIVPSIGGEARLISTGATAGW